MAKIGKYELVRPLTTGHWANTFLGIARMESSDAHLVVVKQLHRRWMGEPLVPATFLAEAWSAAQLDHPNVGKVLDIGVSDGMASVVSEHAGGTVLRELSYVARTNGEPLSLPRCAEIISKACDGLAHAHARHVIHGHLDASRIVAGPDGGVKVVDWGMAPDEGPVDQDLRADIRGLGLALFELIAERESEALERIVEKALQEQYLTCEAMRADLERFLGGRKTTDRTVSGGGPYLASMTTHALPVPEGFQLSAASEFLRGFVPGAGMAPALADPLILAFRLDGGGWEPAAVALRQAGASSLQAEVSEGADPERALAVVRRVLGLDAPDPAAWLALGARVPLLGRLQREFPGFFTVAKPSPYDAGLWGVLATRISMPQAAKMRLALTERCGDDVRVAGRVVRVGPDPRRVVELRSVPGIPEEKLKRAVAVSAAALEGKLEAARLRAMPEEAALAELREIHGVGPWTAAHIFYRGAAPHDGLALEEPRVLNGYADAAGLRQAPSQEQFAEAAEAWRPFRMWTCILLARHLNAAGKWQLPASEVKKRGRRAA